MDFKKVAGEKAINIKEGNSRSDKTFAFA